MHNNPLVHVIARRNSIIHENFLFIQGIEGSAITRSRKGRMTEGGTPPLQRKTTTGTKDEHERHLGEHDVL